MGIIATLVRITKERPGTRACRVATEFLLNMDCEMLQSLVALVDSGDELMIWIRVFDAEDVDAAKMSAEVATF